MSNIPNELKYSKSHEWIKDQGEGIFSIGITDHAQDQLGDMVYVELQEVGLTMKAGEECAVVESVKAASEIFMPISGEIVEVNAGLSDTPEAINQDPYSAGWLLKVKASQVEEIQSLLDSKAYSAFIESESH